MAVTNPAPLSLLPLILISDQALALRFLPCCTLNSLLRLPLRSEAFLLTLCLLILFSLSGLLAFPLRNFALRSQKLRRRVEEIDILSAKNTEMLAGYQMQLKLLPVHQD